MSVSHDKCVITLLCFENNAVVEVDRLGDAMKFCRNTKDIFFYFLRHSVESYEGWNFNSGNYLFTTATK